MMEYVHVYNEGGGIRNVPVEEGALSIGANASLIVAVSRDLTLHDAGLMLFCNSSSSIVMTVPTDDTAGWFGATSIALHQSGVGSVSFAPAAGVTILGTAPTPVVGLTQAITKVITAINTWAYL